MSKEQLIHFLIAICLKGVFSEDEFKFDLNKQPLQRLWGIPDTTAQIGCLFHFEIPKNAFEGNVARFEAYSENGEALPSWLYFDDKAGVLEGVPTEGDLGEHYVMVKAFDDDLNDFVKDVFVLEVLSEHDSCQEYNKAGCKPENEKLMFNLVLDTNYIHLGSLDRVRLIKNFGNFTHLNTNEFHLSHLEKDKIFLNSEVVNAGPGNVRKKKFDSSTLLGFQIGCNGNVWDTYLNFVKLIPKVAKNGTLSENIQKGIIGWRLVRKSGRSHRPRREGGDGYEGSSLEETEQGVGVPEERVVYLNTATPAFTPEPTPTLSESTSRHHRHNHGLGPPHPHSSSSLVLPSFQDEESIIIPTPTYFPDRPTSTEIFLNGDISPSEVIPTSTSSLAVTVDPENRFKSEGPSDIDPFIRSSLPSLNMSTHDDDTTILPKNFPPKIIQRLQKIPTTAGKVFRYKIPANTFVDPEDGDSRNLKISLRLNGSELPPDYWIQFNQSSQEIYALPLEDRISKWSFDLVAVDSGGASVQDSLELWVQDHKGRRAVNHAITLQILSTPPGVNLDWEVKLVNVLSKILADQDSRHITVLNISTTDPIYFSWTNDSLPRNDCPHEEIRNIYKLLTVKGSLEHSEVFDGLRIGKVTWSGKGICESKPPEVTNENYPPVPRNQVDKVNATVGQLLLYSVPEDTFYDPEDGSARNLKLSLVTKDGQQLPANHWLQFDVKNQQFYGIPMAPNVGQTEYLLVCTDGGGLTARDGLVVIVYPAPRVLYNVEFSMKLSIDYGLFTESPTLQRTFVERLASLFGDRDTNSVVLSGVSPGSTVVTWHNRSLPTNLCPDNKIRILRQIILGDDERVTPRVGQMLGEEFPVVSARLTPTGLCQGTLPEVAGGGGGSEVAASDLTPITTHSDQYIIGLIIPAIVISVMLLSAGLVACVLYRRRRTGKMSVGDEDERQTFRSKGIPVIFQDELDERPEPSNKSPVIMKEEKPPLPPPEYQRIPLATTALLSDTEDSPYQPPPPFTTSRDSARPKPTPTYRIPPPYVPP